MQVQSGVKITIPKQGQISGIFGGWKALLPTRLRKATKQARTILVDALSEYPP